MYGLFKLHYRTFYKEVSGISAAKFGIMLVMYWVVVECCIVSRCKPPLRMNMALESHFRVCSGIWVISTWFEMLQLQTAKLDLQATNQSFGALIRWRHCGKLRHLMGWTVDTLWAVINYSMIFSAAVDPISSFPFQNFIIYIVVNFWGQIPFQHLYMPVNDTNLWQLPLNGAVLHNTYTLQSWSLIKALFFNSSKWVKSLPLEMYFNEYFDCLRCQIHRMTLKWTVKFV